MDFFIARQPIFSIHKQLVAYELLYRGTDQFPLTGVSGNQATTSLLSSTFLTEGIDIVSKTKPCFVNFTEELLKKKLPASFSKTKLVIEILEDVRPTKEIIAVCRELSKEGYKIALDDFVYDRKLEPLIEIADIIKIDFRLTPVNTIHKTLHKLSKHNVKLLAEKVESHKEFEKAAKLGFSLFQGFFFSKPEKILIKELALAKITLLNLLVEVTQKKTTIERLYEIFSTDVAISYKLLRFVNSAYFYRMEEVKTLKHAIAFVGEKELRRFVILIVVSELTLKKPGELVRLSLVRAKFCELLSLQSQYKNFSSEMFLMGMFSLIDSMLDSTMDIVMAKLPIGRKVKEALAHQKGDFMPFLEAVIAYERGQIDACTDALDDVKVDIAIVPGIYLDALRYANMLT
jgi:c-di-GMP-related signal transduction protein